MTKTKIVKDFVFYYEIDGVIRVRITENITNDFIYHSGSLKSFIDTLSDIDDRINDADLIIGATYGWDDSYLDVYVEGWREATSDEINWYRTEKEKRETEKKAAAKTKREANKAQREKALAEAVALLEKQNPEKLKELINAS